MRKETNEAARPIAMLSRAMRWIIDENPSFDPELIRLDMKYDRFNFC